MARVTVRDGMKAPIKIGRKQSMKVTHMKGIATHHGPESCLDIQQWYGEALTGESAGTVMSSEITQIRRRTLYTEGERHINQTAMARCGWLRRSQSTVACVEAFYTGIGRPGKLPHQRQEEGGWYQ
jgi:hypothetical protein